MSKPKIGVLLAGCGVYDGSEIHEAVLTLLAIDRGGAEAICLAPDANQMHVVDHLSGQPVPGERRNVLVEAARVARGQVAALAAFDASRLDALVIPGGFGAAKNLCDFAVAGAGCTVPPDVDRLVREMNADGRWIGAMCIAPVILAKVLGAVHPRLTIGNDARTAAALEAMGARHVACRAGEIVVDETNRIVTTPAYMLAGSIAEAAAGIQPLVAEVVRRVKAGVPVGV